MIVNEAFLRDGSEGPPVFIPDKALTEAAFCDWIGAALVGERIQYHEGLLLRDRSSIGSLAPARERERINQVARRAWTACELGLVHLFSQRLGDSHYRYIAVRSSAPRKAPQLKNRFGGASAGSSPTH